MPMPMLPRVLAVISNDPARAFVWLHALRSQLTIADDADTCGTGTVVDGDALLSKTRNPESLSALLRASKGRATLVEIGRRGDVRPSLGDAHSHSGPYRWRGFVGAGVGGPIDADQAGALQQLHLAALPDDVRRAVSGAHEREAFLLRMLVAWQQQRLLEQPTAMTNMLASLHASARLASPTSPRISMISDGQQVWCHAHGMSIHALTQVGLPEDAAEQLDVSFTDGNSARERLKRFRGVVIIGGTDAPAGWQSWSCAADGSLAVGVAADHRVVVLPGL
jgi:hypothetical protein